MAESLNGDPKRERAVRLGIQDERVLRAFVDREPLEGHKLWTDGRQLSGRWLGGARIAEWRRGQIHTPDLGSRVADSVQKRLRAHASPIQMADYKTFARRGRAQRDPANSTRGRDPRATLKGLSRAMYAMAVNAEGERGRGAEVHVAWPQEKRAVAALEKAGLVKVRRTKDRVGDFTEWWYRLA